MIAERFPNLARHWDVLKASWSRQNIIDAMRRPTSDQEFLPAALEILEKPPSPGLRYLMLGLCGLFTIAVLWAIFGRIDVVAVASGKVVPSGNVKVIQPMEIGSVRAIHVRNGQRVKAGQLLLELDPTIAGADVAQASQGLLDSQVVASRNAALLAHLQGRPARFVAPPGTPPAIAANQARYVSATVGEYEAERANLRQQRAEQQAELASAKAEIAKLEKTLPLVDRQMQARKDLAEKGYYAKLKVLEYEQLRLEHVQNIAVHEADAAKARATIASIEAQLRRLRETFGKAAATELAQAQNEVRQRSEDVTKSQRRRAFQQLRAPVSGTVQQLVVTTIGGVVQPAQPLMVIVPDGVKPVVEAQILNKDIGFVREGQPVRIKLEAFNFTDYGIIPGVVESISRDAVDLSEAGPPKRDSNNRPVQPGLVYPVRIRLLQDTIRVAGKDQPIGPGLAVQAEIKTDERRIIQFLLSPIAKTVDEAAREK